MTQKLGSQNWFVVLTCITCETPDDMIEFLDVMILAVLFKAVRMLENPALVGMAWPKVKLHKLLLMKEDVWCLAAWA